MSLRDMVRGPRRNPEVVAVMQVVSNTESVTKQNCKKIYKVGACFSLLPCSWDSAKNSSHGWGVQGRGQILSHSPDCPRSGPSFESGVQLSGTSSQLKFELSESD